MKTVLSIQSAVTMGAVGNTMANMAMNAMGLGINRVDTVHLAAHPGYGIIAGGRLNQDVFENILSGLIDLKVWQSIDAIMTGYMADAAQAQPVADMIKNLKSHRPDLPVLVDPAIGDHGRLYVNENIAQAMQDHLFDQANLITPNGFELSYFSGIEIKDQSDAVEAASHILDRFDHMTGVAATGLRLNQDQDIITDCWITKDNAIFYDKPSLKHQPQGLSGGGDLFSALMISHHMKGQNWADAADKASQDTHMIMSASDQEGLAGQAQILPSAIFDYLARN